MRSGRYCRDGYGSADDIGMLAGVILWMPNGANVMVLFILQHKDGNHEINI
jgi:hypothetical protein